MVIRRDEAKRHRIVRRSLQLPARKHPRRIAINQQAQQHLRVVRRRTRPAIAANKRPQIQPFNHLNHKARQMTFRQPLIYRWRQQKPRLTVHLAKIAHPPTAHGAPTKQPYPHYGLTPPKSDRLLVPPLPSLVVAWLLYPTGPSLPT